MDNASRHTLVTSMAGLLLGLAAMHPASATAAAAPGAPEASVRSPQTTDELKQRIAVLEQQLRTLQSQQADCAERSRQCATDLQRAVERIRELEAVQAAPGGTAPSGTSEPGQTPAPPAGGDPSTAPVDPNAPTPGAPTAPAAPVAPAAPSAPSNPFDNTATVIDAVKARFAADFAGRPSPADGVADERLTRLWMTEIERWANHVNREMRRPVTWTVRVINAESSGRSWRLDVVCVDPELHTDIGRPFSIQLQSVQAGPFEQALKMGQAGNDFLLRGVFIPQIAINPSRYEPGPFDQPPFIGTFLEFGFRMNVTSMVRVEGRAAPATGPVPPTTPPAPPAGSTPPAGAAP